MKFRFLLIGLLVVFSSVGSYADDGFDVTYKLPIVPIEITFDKGGFSWRASRTIVTPLGSFSLGHSKYEYKFDEDYTYVIIEDLNSKKEYIYKVNNKKRLRLVSEGRTEIEINNRKVKITVNQGSTFKVSFSLEGEETSTQSNATTKWITPSNRVCKKYGGQIEDGVCEAPWKDAKSICSASGGALPSLEALKQVVMDCGGEMKDNSFAESKRNRNNSNYQSCYKEKGFTSSLYWSSIESTTYRAFCVFFSDGYMDYSLKCDSNSVRCVRSGQ